MEVVLALGANLGDKTQNIGRAIDAIAEEVGTVLKRSKNYETKPLLDPETPTLNQDNYVNCAVLVDTDLHPQDLLRRCQAIEESLGRARDEHTPRWGPRTIDIDIIAAGDLVVAEENLKIPHVEMHKRDFVLDPMVDILPDWVHPLLKKSAAALRQDVRPDSHGQADADK